MSFLRAHNTTGDSGTAGEWMGKWVDLWHDAGCSGCCSSCSERTTDHPTAGVDDRCSAHRGANVGGLLRAHTLNVHSHDAYDRALNQLVTTELIRSHN